MSLMRPQASEEQNVQKAIEFEEMFLNFFLTRMMPKSEDGFFGSGNSNEIYKSFWGEAVAKQIARKGGGLGVAKMAKKALDKARYTTPDNLSNMRGSYDIRI
jgi:Rod binding domain-containing protein